MRLTTIQDIAFKFYKPLFERIWFAAGFMWVILNIYLPRLLIHYSTSIILPLVIYRVLSDSLNVDDKFATLREREQRFFEARSISMGVLVGCLVFFWVPLAVWKFIVSDYCSAPVSTILTAKSTIGSTPRSCSDWSLGPCGCG